LPLDYKAMNEFLKNIYYVTLGFEVLAVVVAAIRFKYAHKSKILIWAVYIFFGTIVYEIAYEYLSTIYDYNTVRIAGSNLVTALEFYSILYVFVSINPVILSRPLFYGLLLFLFGLLLFESFSVQVFFVSHQFALGDAIITKMLVAPIAIFCSLKVIIEMYRNDYYYPQIPFFWLSIGIFFNYTFSLIVSFPDIFTGSDTIKVVFFAIYCLFVIISNIIFAYAFWLTKSWIKRGGSTLKY
jgi:hypothetical protein